MRSGRKSASQTPAPLKDRIYGSKKNKEGSASSDKSAKNISLSVDILVALTKKLKEFKKENPNSDNITLNDLKAVYRRGLGAYSSTHRPTITGGVPNTRNAWAMARVNKFLLKAGGTKVKKAYVQDDDLIKYQKGGLIAPNGKTSNLTPEQYKLVRTPEFKAWFGDWENDPENASKVVDENGEPLVVYHGTRNEFFTFDSSKIGKKTFNKQGFYFSSNFNVANSYLYEDSYGANIKHSGFIIKCFLNIKNPIEIDWHNKDWKHSDFESTMKSYQYFREIGVNDGIILLNLSDPFYISPIDFVNKLDYSGNNYIVDNSSQIKLADGTNTTFDINNPDIRFDKGGNLKNNNMFETIGRLIRPNTLEQIAKEHNVNMGFLQKQFEIGTKEEMEHTFDTETAETIALHHLNEDPNYYIRLKQMMLQSESQKLDDYYANGGQVLNQAKCEVLDSNGERKIDPISIAKLTECVNNLPQTKTMHYDFENDKYKDYRTRLQKEIIYDIKKNVVCVETQNQPIAILMGGSPASGKSTFLKKYAEYLLQDEILKIDADEIRSKLPEYKGYNASQTHLETKDIVTTLLSNRNIGIPCLFDVIYDGTMNNTKSYLPLISLLKSLGYKVFMVYIDNVPKEVAIERSLQRYKKSGRFVPIEVIEDFFDKGKSAMEQIKKEVDGYMIVDGGNSNYDIIEQGGMKLPQNREYSKIGSPIQITTDEVVREFKKGGEVNPDDAQIKDMVTHKSGEVGGLLVGNRHSEGGIKAVNKSTGQPLEMEGGEVVITRNAVSDTKKRMFEGEMLTNREILSRINEEGGGVSFEEGGKVEDDDCGCNHKMKKGGDLLKDTLKAPKKITDKINEMFADKFQFEFENGGQVYSKEELIRIVNKQVPSFVAYKNHKKPDPIKDKLEYKNYLYNVYDVRFEELPQMIQMGLLVGSQTIVDNYLNKK